LHGALTRSGAGIDREIDVVAAHSDCHGWFDWAFVNHYFVEYGPDGRNPFGIGALDIKAYAMGAA
jgi:hypothetical protein